MSNVIEGLSICGGEAGASSAEGVFAVLAAPLSWHMHSGKSMLLCQNTMGFPHSGVADRSGVILCQNRYPTTVAGHHDDHHHAMSARSLNMLADS